MNGLDFVAEVSLSQFKSTDVDGLKSLVRACRCDLTQAAGQLWILGANFSSQATGE